jgi:hypothetical protein
MEYLIGLILSLVVAGFAIIVGFDRDRSFCPTVLIVIASYYVLFAVMGASERTLVIEIAAASSGARLSPDNRRACTAAPAAAGFATYIRYNQQFL